LLQTIFYALLMILKMNLTMIWMSWNHLSWTHLKQILRNCGCKMKMIRKNLKQMICFPCYFVSEQNRYWNFSGLYICSEQQEKWNWIVPYY
jgi:hypothetical protein